MKNLLNYILFFFLFLCLSLRSVHSQNYTICNWQDDKKAAVVLSFDDWSPGQFPIAVKELNARGLRGTFFATLTNIKAFDASWENINTTVLNHEIGNHTQTHKHLNALSADDLSFEIRGFKEIADENIRNSAVLTFAYPFGTGAGNSEKDNQIQDSIRASGHIAARSVFPSSRNYTYNFASEDDDYYKIPTFEMNAKISKDDFVQQIDNVIEGGGLLVYMYHSLDNAAGEYNDNWYAQVKESDFQLQMDTLKSLSREVWQTTFVDAVRYHREKNSAILKEVAKFDGVQVKLSLSDTMNNNKIYNVPLTIKVKQQGHGYNSIMQNKKMLSIDLNTKEFIQFKAIPNAGEIVISVKP